MIQSQAANLLAKRDRLLSLTLEMAELIDQRSKLVSDIQELKKTHVSSPSQSSYSAWSPWREHDVFKALFAFRPQLSDSTLFILSLMIENQVQQAQGEISYPAFSNGAHLLSAEMNTLGRAGLKINPILARYFRPQLYLDKQLHDWALKAIFLSTNINT